MRKAENAEKIRALYLESGLTYRKLSEITGIKENTLANWITNRKSPPDYVVEWISLKIGQYQQESATPSIDE